MTQLFNFILDAKRATYASEEDDSPLLAGSRQLEYRDGSLFYRDIYFGVSFFVGQETVYYDEQPVWSMGYSGGVEKTIVSRDDVKSIYAFLRSALRQVSRDNPFRAPKEYCIGIYTYNAHEGDFATFWGDETICRGNDVVYRLKYTGGLLR